MRWRPRSLSRSGQVHGSNSEGNLLPNAIAHAFQIMPKTGALFQSSGDAGSDSIPERSPRQARRERLRLELGSGPPAESQLARKRPKQGQRRSLTRKSEATQHQGNAREELSTIRVARHLPGLVRAHLHGVDSLRVSPAGSGERPTCYSAAKRHGCLYSDSVPEPGYAHRDARLCCCTDCDAIRLLQRSSEATDTSRMHGALLRRGGIGVVHSRSGDHARALRRGPDSGPVGLWSTS